MFKKMQMTCSLIMKANTFKIIKKKKKNIYVILCLHFVKKLLNFIYMPKGRDIFNQLIQYSYKI